MMKTRWAGAAGLILAMAFFSGCGGTTCVNIENNFTLTSVATDSDTSRVSVQGVSDSGGCWSTSDHHPKKYTTIDATIDLVDLSIESTIERVRRPEIEEQPDFRKRIFTGEIYFPCGTCELRLSNGDPSLTIIARDSLTEDPPLFDDGGERVFGAMLLSLELADGRTGNYVYGIGYARRGNPEQ